MSEPREAAAWLETVLGERVPIERACTLGRAQQNRVVLADTRVSRRHALIQVQGEGECWLVDFGSANGTRVNGRRIAVPTRLRDGDLLELGGVRFRFRKAVPAIPEAVQATSSVTVREVRREWCWLLVADIMGSTVLTRTLAPEELPLVFGRWFAACREAVEQSGGTLNQYLGDGCLAFWQEPPEMSAQVVRTLETLDRMQQTDGPGHLAFRAVLHYGEVALGGARTTGEESLVGTAVHFVFRMEKLAGSMGRSILLSQAAADRVGRHRPLPVVGHYALSGFEGDFLFYGFQT